MGGKGGSADGRGLFRTLQEESGSRGGSHCAEKSDMAGKEREKKARSVCEKLSSNKPRISANLEIGNALLDR